MAMHRCKTKDKLCRTFYKLVSVQFTTGILYNTMTTFSHKLTKKTATKDLEI